LSVAATIDAKVIVLRAERKLGKWLGEAADAKVGARPSPQLGDTMSPNQLYGQSLVDLGISKKESERWQTEASVPDAAFEGYALRRQAPSHNHSSASAC
jgi:hypothetical protein